MDQQNQNARYLDKFNTGHTNVKIHNPPGGASSFSLGWDAPEKPAPKKKISNNITNDYMPEQDYGNNNLNKRRSQNQDQGYYQNQNMDMNVNANINNDNFIGGGKKKVETKHRDNDIFGGYQDNSKAQNSYNKNVNYDKFGNPINQGYKGGMNQGGQVYKNQQDEEYGDDDDYNNQQGGYRSNNQPIYQQQPQINNNNNQVKTSVKVSNQPGGNSTFKIGYDYNDNQNNNKNFYSYKK